MLPRSLILSENGGDVNDSVDCIIRNFVEMNRLWIRMQAGAARDKDKREAYRKDLRVLVGSNFACLSQLDRIDADYYMAVRFHGFSCCSESCRRC